jgi:superfamily II DNA or RNA helicase
MLGLTATPTRRDKLDPVINFFLGKVLHRSSKRELQATGAVLRPDTQQIETGFEYEYCDDYPMMISALVNNPGRNRLIVDVVLQHRARGVALVVSDRKSHCKFLASLFKKTGCKAESLTGDLAPALRKEIVGQVDRGEIEVLVATVQLVGEGFDCSGLTVLALATPIASSPRLLQAAGRVMRPGIGKKPLVIDFVDGRVPLLAHRAKKRLHVLKAL